MEEVDKRATGQVAEAAGIEYAVKNRMRMEDAALHGWYRFVLGYPPHLVRQYLETLGADPAVDWVFDPFCGTGTTPVEARLQGFAVAAMDVNPVSFLATRVKLAWDIDLDRVHARLEDILSLAAACLRQVHLTPIPKTSCQLPLFDPWVSTIEAGRDGRIEQDFDPDNLLSPEAKSLIPRGFISPKPLLRVLAVRYAIERVVPAGDVRDWFFLALANTVVGTAGNVAFGPEVYALPPREDADVLGVFASTVTRMISDLQDVLRRQPQPVPPAVVFYDDARTMVSLEQVPAIGIVITSPPYPNEKDYTRSTRLESVLLGLIKTKQDLRRLKEGLLRSNTRNVFVQDDDDRFVRDIPSVVQIAQEIEEKRRRLGKTSGFERLYHRVTLLYFGGMYRHLASLLPRLRPGARCAYVVGDQMSYFRVPIRTAHLLADVAKRVGYEVEGIELWRTRRATATKMDLEENVLIIRRPMPRR